MFELSVDHTTLNSCQTTPCPSFSWSRVIFIELSSTQNSLAHGDIFTEKLRLHSVSLSIFLVLDTTV